MLRGLVQVNPSDTYSSYKALYRIGNAVIPLAEAHLMKYAWDDIHYESQIDTLTGLLSLIQDIDEEAAARAAGKIRRAGCRPVIQQRIDTILTFSLSHYNQYRVHGIHVCQKKSLGGEAFIRERVTAWLDNVDASDLEGIERLNIVPSSDEDYMGTYMPRLCKVMIEWPAVWSRYDPVSWLWLLEVEFTLYHEIGHHACGHDFGSDPEKEREANRYAQRIYDRVHPRLKKVRTHRRRMWQRIQSTVDRLRESES